VGEAKWISVFVPASWKTQRGIHKALGCKVFQKQILDKSIEEHCKYLTFVYLSFDIQYLNISCIIKDIIRKEMCPFRLLHMYKIGTLYY